MKKGLISSLLMIAAFTAGAQEPDSLAKNTNIAEKLLQSEKGLTLGGYGEVHYNQPVGVQTKQQGQLDVHRVVMFMGYNFNSKTQFITEIEFEYAREVWIEQAFLQHKLNTFMNFRAGLMLVPMGIINEHHEPTRFHGTERPLIDNRIAPSTWREVGAGFAGTVLPLSIRYQTYVTSGLSGYDTKAVFSGSKGFRDGRQKGSKAYVFSPALSGRVEYFGIRNLVAGLSGYWGKSQSLLYSGLHNDSLSLKANADSSVVGIGMLGADVRYRYKGVELRGQYYLTGMTNTDQYNVFTRASGKKNDLGRRMTGYYVEAAYNILRPAGITGYELLPFVRYEFFDMHHAVGSEIVRNDAYKNTVITSGLTFRLHRNAVIKADMQFLKTALTNDWIKVFNAGVGVMF